MSAQTFLYKRYVQLHTKRFFRWKVNPGQRFYSLKDNDENVLEGVTMDPNKTIEWCGIQDSRNVWYPMIQGIPPQLYTMITKPWRPARYELRGAIEIYPVPDQTYWLWVRAHFGLMSFVNPTDKTTIDSELVFLWALANAKAHYGQPDAQNIAGQANAYKAELIAATHQTAHYLPGTIAVPPAVRPTLIQFDANNGGGIMRPYPLTVLNGGINRLRVKGGASASRLYDLTNAFITNAGSIVPREGTLRAATLDSTTVGLAAANGTFNIFSSTYTTVGIPTGYTLNVLQNPINPTASVTKIWFAKPFMGFEYVVAEFSDGNVFTYWLQNDGTWASNTVYTTASIVLPPIANGLAYQGVSRFTSGTAWTPDTVVTSGAFILPNTPTGFVYEIISIAGANPHTGASEPNWSITSGSQIQEFGDFDQSSTDGGTTGPYTTGANLSQTITNKYGVSNTISNSGIYASSLGTLSTLTLASTKIKTWVAGTTYPSGSVVIPTVSSSSSTFINAIPNGDFSGGSGLGGWVFADPGGVAAWNYTTGSSPISIGIGADVGGASIGIPGGTSMGAAGASATMLTSGAVTPGQTVIATGYCNPNNNGADLTIWIQLNWYNSSNVLIGQTGNEVNEQEGMSTVLLSVKGVAPASAAGVRVAVYAGAGTTVRNEGYVGGLFWNLASPSAITNFLYEAVQPAAGISGGTQPAWPTMLGNEVIDGSVTWQAIGTSIITYEAIPLMQSGANAPTFPTTIGAIVLDTSTFPDINGYIINTTMAWQAINREVSDPNNPNTPAVTIGASHVFAGNNDIVDYSAAVNPIDWTSTNNAGYCRPG